MQQTMTITVLTLAGLVAASGCVSSMEVHADIATSINEAVENERETYRDERRGAMRAAGGSATGDVEAAVRAAGDEFNTEHNAWRTAIAGVAIALNTYVAAVLAQKSGWKQTAARLLREVVAAYEEIRRHHEGAPVLPTGLIDAGLRALEGS